MQTIRTERSIWDRDTQRFEDPDHTLHTYTQMYGVFFLMFTHSHTVFMKDAGRFVTVLTRPFWFWPAACFFSQGFSFFPCSSWVNVFWVFLSQCYSCLYAKNSLHNYFLRSLTCPWVILSVYFCLCFRLIIIMCLEGFCMCGERGCSLQDPVFLRLFSIYHCSFPLPLKFCFP